MGVELKAERITKTARITLNGDLEQVFALFGPIEEGKWAPGWNPKVLYLEQGFIEEHMVFITEAHAGQETDYTWTVSKFDKARTLVEYTVFAPERLWFITISCKEINESAGTEAEITYTYTGFTEKGCQMNRHALQTMFLEDLKDWETQINYYLRRKKIMGAK